MIKKSKILFLCLFVASCSHYAVGQIQGAIIDLGQISDFTPKSNNTSPTLQLQNIHEALQSNSSLTFMNSKGFLFKSRFEKIEIANQTKFHIASGPKIEPVNLNSTVYQYYHSVNSKRSLEEILLKVNSKEVSGTWIGEEQVIEFDLGRHFIKKHDKINKIDSSNTIDHQCSIQLSRSATSKTGISKSINSGKTINLGVILDYSYVNSAGGLQNAVDKVVSVLAASSIDFNSDFNAQIKLEISDIVLSGCESCDPWTTSTNSTEVQTSVREWVIKSETLSQNDLILFWSDRNFDNDIIGSAQTKSVCTEYNTVILKDKSDILWELRVIASHEIAHTLGSLHDSNFSNTIMHPSLINSSVWSSSSIQAINEGLLHASCLNNISEYCAEITNVNIENRSSLKFRISFNNGGADSVLIEMNNLTTGIIISKQIAESNTSWIEEDYNPCQDYSIVLSPYCDGVLGTSKGVLWSSRADDSFSVESVSPQTCRVENNKSVYDLAFRISNPLARTIQVSYKEEEYDIFLYEGIHSYVIPNIPTSEFKDVGIYFMEVATGNYGCFAAYYIDEPSVECAFQYVESFDNCFLPSGWRSYRSEGNIHEEFKWKIKNGDRPIQNYGNAGNAQSTKSIDGSCMAVIDDDLINLSNHSGIAYLESSTFDLERYDSAVLSFDLIFDEFIEKGNNESLLKIEVRIDDSWQEIDRISENSCPWYGIWDSRCIQSMILDLTPYKSDKLAVRWQFSDGGSGQWTGMAALDNVTIDARELHLNPCNQEDIYIYNSPKENISTSGNMLYVSTMIDISEANFSVSQGAIFSPGSAVETGVNLNVAIKPCKN